MSPSSASASASAGSLASMQLGFLACPRRFNVAISRAKALNVIVGHPVALCHWPHWQALLQHCVARGAYLGGGAEYLPRVTITDAAATAAAAADDSFGAGGVEAGVGGQREGEGEGEEHEGVEDDDWEDDGYDEIAETIGKIAELSLLGGGDGGGMFYDDDDDMMASAFSDEQVWRVAL